MMLEGKKRKKKEAKNILAGSNKSRRSRAEVTEQAFAGEKMVLLNRGNRLVPDAAAATHENSTCSLLR